MTKVTKVWFREKIKRLNKYGQLTYQLEWRETSLPWYKEARILIALKNGKTKVFIDWRDADEVKERIVSISAFLHYSYDFPLDSMTVQSISKFVSFHQNNDLSLTPTQPPELKRINFEMMNIDRQDVKRAIEQLNLQTDAKFIADWSGEEGTFMTLAASRHDNGRYNTLWQYDLIRGWNNLLTFLTYLKNEHLFTS